MTPAFSLIKQGARMRAYKSQNVSSTKENCHAEEIPQD